MRRPLAVARRSLLIAPLIAASLAASLAVSPVTAGTVAAASDGLSLTTSTTYTLVPADRVVRAAVDINAANDKPNRVSGGVTTRYFYDSFRIAVQPEARSIRATAAGAALRVSTLKADGYLRVEVRLRQPIFFHQAARVRVTFDLPGGAPRSKSEIRVGPAFATFVAWAFGDSGSVRIVVPAEFDTGTTGNAMTRAESDGSIVLTADVPDVSRWYVVLNADRPSELTDTDLPLSDGGDLRIRAWPDDPTWGREVTDLLRRGLPELVQLTGLSWPVTDALTVSEVHTPLLEGYAGVFYQGRNRIEISEDLDDLTIVHEASHAWFNGNLFRGRWIVEGLADTYASEALNRIGLTGWRPDAVAPSDKAAVKLNAWVTPGRISDAATDAREQFGYDASWMVVSSIVNDVGIEKMQAVLARADAGEIAYAGAGTPEDVSGPADWRRLLDLLDEVGGSTTADELFRTWVISSSDLGSMDERDAARAAYAGLVREGGDWLPPLFVRQPLSDWTFGVATTRIRAAATLLDARDRIAAEAANLGVTAPTTLRTAYQTASTSLDAAAGIADRELAELRALRAAADAVDAPRDALVALGLLGIDPAARLADVRAGFSAGADDTIARAASVADLIAGGAASGRQRLLVVIVGADALFGLVVIAVVARRRRRPPRTPMAHPRPYATLAAPSGSGESGEATPVAPPSVDVAERAPSDEPSAGTHPPIATEPFVASEPPPTGDAS
jgi:hypothetical protein